MRALAAKQITGYDEAGNEKTVPLHVSILVHNFIDVGEQRRRPVYKPTIGGTFTSLHKAKNAIRRHFGIESRKMLRWEERSR